MDCHFDLSCSLGCPGKFDHREFKGACKYVSQAAENYNKALGRLAGTPAETIAFHREGYDLLCYSRDSWVHPEAMFSGIRQIRDSCKT